MALTVPLVAVGWRAWGWIAGVVTLLTVASLTCAVLTPLPRKLSALLLLPFLTEYLR